MNYINNKKFLEELEKCSETDSSEELGKMFLLLAKRYSEKGSFVGYTWRDDMISEAVLTCLRYKDKFEFSVDNPNPFAYFSRVVHNAFLNYIAKQKRHSSIKDICYKNIETIMPESLTDSDYEFFNVSGINYQPIRGNKKKRRVKKKKMTDKAV